MDLKGYELNSYMDKYNDEFLFSGTVSVKKGDDIIFQKGYGLASVEHGVSNTIDTVFRLYSLSKQFTAAAVLLLEEKGLLELSNKLSDYFPKITNLNKKITLYQLLTHTSGIFNYSDIEFSHTRIYNLHLSNDEIISLFKDKSLSFEPGADYEYCNSGYFLLSLIIEKVSGLSYEEFLNENIFNPLDMKDTYVDEGNKIIKNMATGYYINNRNLVHCNYIDMNNLRGSGNICSTVNDINKWTSGLFEERIIIKKQLEKMITPYKSNYGCGVFINNNTKCINHTGAAEGFLTQLNYYPQHKLTIQVLSNLGFTNTYDICNNLASIVFEQEYSMPQKPKSYELSKSKLNKILGMYKDSDSCIEVFESDDNLYFRLNKCNTFLIYPISEDTFQNEFF